MNLRNLGQLIAALDSGAACAAVHMTVLPISVCASAPGAVAHNCRVCLSGLNQCAQHSMRQCLVITYTRHKSDSKAPFVDRTQPQYVPLLTVKLSI